MRPIHIVGSQNHGKTTLMEELIRELASRGWRVGTIKHSGHAHVLDRPGKDSFRHQQAGGLPSAVITPERVGLFFERPSLHSPYEELAPFYEGCDIVLVEGDVQAEAPKVEVWRAALGTAPLAGLVSGVVAIVTDDPLEASCPRWPRRDVPALCDKLLELSRGATTGRKDW